DGHKEGKEGTEQIHRSRLTLPASRLCLINHQIYNHYTEIYCALAESYSEPPDVQRQLNHYTLMAQAGDASKANAEGAGVAESSLFHCEVCNFNTGHLSSMRRHYLNRHGKKMLKCRDCNFFSGLRKTLEMHTEVGHSTCQSEPTHQKDLRCPFCLYQTKNKTNMIDHIVLHREERVVPIEVRRPKLSRYLQGIVFRCHKCTFTCGSPENLRLHMMKHDDIKPYKCRLCYFDCTRLSDLEAHLSDKHQIIRNHELVGQISLDQLEARAEKMSEEEPLSDLSVYAEDIKTEEIDIDCNEDKLFICELCGRNLKNSSELEQFQFLFFLTFSIQYDTNTFSKNFTNTDAIMIIILI
uniref:C2H2-type domain-containing protein n=1 Tax=Mola mola TaxID=94237 RepID=A0A3Q3XCX7_MOLML